MLSYNIVKVGLFTNYRSIEVIYILKIDASIEFILI